MSWINIIIIIAVLFSGGLDSSVLACLLDMYLPEEQTIDLINVAFAQKSNKNNPNKKKKGKIVDADEDQSLNFDVPDRLTGYIALEDLKKLFPRRNYNFVEVSKKNNDDDKV